jgi:hypothetical protein
VAEVFSERDELRVQLQDSDVVQSMWDRGAKGVELRNAGEAEGIGCVENVHCA